jgi:hypothetical protein
VTCRTRACKRDVAGVEQREDLRVPSRRSARGVARTERCPRTRARIVWADDGEEHVDTVALGWTSRDVYVRLPDPRYRFTAVWLDASDVKRR